MVAKKDTSGESTAVEPIDGLADSALRKIESIADVLRLTQGNVPSVGDILGDGFSVLTDKRLLLDKAFVIVRYGQHTSEKNGGTFTTLHVVTDTGEKLIVNDGSTGIHAQCQEIRNAMGRVAPLHVPRGLRMSEYDYTNEKGEVSRATTFYLNQSK
jgi:hypothetical protein